MRMTSQQFFCHFHGYRNDPKISDGQLLANSIDPDFSIQSASLPFVNLSECFGPIALQ